MICPNCQKENGEGAKFCAGCGKNFSVVGQTSTNGWIKEKASLVGMGIVALAFLLLTGIVEIPFLKDSPSDVLKKSATAMANGDYVAFKKTLSRDTVVQMESMAAMTGVTMAQGLSESRSNTESKKGVKGIEVLSEKITGDNADVCLKINYGDGSADDGSSRCASLIKEGGEWKINY